MDSAELRKSCEEAGNIEEISDVYVPNGKDFGFCFFERRCGASGGPTTTGVALDDENKRRAWT